MSYLDALPVALRDELARPCRGGSIVLPLEQREAIAREALTMGTRSKGPVLVYVVRRLAFGLGARDHPLPPAMTGQERAYVDARLVEAVGRLRAEFMPDKPPPLPDRISVDTDGYTDPDNVATLADHPRYRPATATPTTPGGHVA